MSHERLQEAFDASTAALAAEEEGGLEFLGGCRVAVGISGRQVGTKTFWMAELSRAFISTPIDFPARSRVVCEVMLTSHCHEPQLHAV